MAIGAVVRFFNENREKVNDIRILKNAVGM